MRILAVEPRDIHVILDIGFQELVHLLNFLSTSTSTYDGEKQPEMKEAGEYIKNEFYPFLVKLKEDMENDSRSNSSGS